jgi:tetratricopeptide (TPR) repeat protein
MVRVQPEILNHLLGRDTGMNSIMQAVGPTRSIQGRLAGFHHTPFEAPLRSTAGTRADDWDLQATVMELESARATSTIHALGVGYLLLGRHEDAIRELQAAIERHGNDASLLIDYAVALSERGLAQGLESDLTRARSALEQALRIRPNSLEALFNRALVLGALGEAASAEAWRAYLAVDSVSPWAVEARARLNPTQGRLP